MSQHRFIIALFPLLICTLSGCSSLMQGLPLPDGYQVKTIAKADAGGPFAVNRDGSFAAVSKGAVEVIDPQLAVHEIAKGSATALAFSPSGDKLAAAMPPAPAKTAEPAGNVTILRLFDRQGKLLAETVIPAKVTSLAWRSENQLLATALTIRKFSFGSEVISHLYRWDGTGTALSTDLGDVTLPTRMAKMADQDLLGTLSLAVSPYGDEIAYSSLKAPPLFNSYLMIATRHLESGAQHEVTQTSVGSGGPLYTPYGESLLVGNALGLTRQVALPDGHDMYAWPSQGSYPAISPSGRYLFLDGQLYEKGRTVASFPKQARAVFLPDGSGLAISCDGRLYLVTGFQDQAAPPLPGNLNRLLQLRKLRSTGLISEKEYQAQKAKAQKEKSGSAR